MSSKMVTRQYGLTSLAAGAALENAAVVAARIQELLASQDADPGVPVDWQASIDKVGRFLQQTAAQLVERDEENERARTREVQLRDQRDQAAEQVRSELRSLRFLFDEVFGKTQAKRLFPARRALSALEPQSLVRMARELAELLRSDRINWPIQPVGRHLTPAAELAASLEASSRLLETPLEVLRPKQRGAEVSRDVKNLELELATDRMKRGTDFLFGVYRLAGFDRAAAKLRPGRVRRKTEMDPDSGAMAAPAVPSPASVSVL